MAAGMLGAAMASGFGQGLANASSTAMQLVGTSMLQRERADMENKRLALLESYATAREQRGYQHQDETLAKTQEFQRGLQQEKIGAEIALKGQDHTFTSQEKAAEREFTGTENARNREATAQIHDESNAVTMRGQDITKQHGEDTLAAQKQHWSTMADLYRAQHRSDKSKIQGFQTAEDGSTLVITQGEGPDGYRASVLRDPRTGDPVKSAKQLTDAVKELNSLDVKEGEALFKSAGADTLSAQERQDLIDKGQSKFLSARTRTGEKPAQPSGGSGSDLASLDPWKKPGPSSAPPSPTAVDRAKVGESYLESKKSESDQRKEETKRGAMEAMGYESGTGMAVKAPPPPPIPAPSTQPAARMEHQRPTGMQQPDEVASPPPTQPAAPSKSPVVANVPRELPRANVTSPDTFLAEKRQEAEQRAAVVQPKSLMESTGLLNPANANIAPKLGKLGTEITGKTAEGRPIVKNPDGTVSTERTITEQVNGKWMNIPSMYGGKEVSTEDAIRIIEQNKGVDPETGRKLPTFGSMEEAVAAAKARSNELGKAYGNGHHVSKATENTVKSPESRASQDMLSPDQYQEAKAKINRAARAFQSGAMSEIELRAEVFDALKESSGRVTDYVNEAQSIVDHIVKQFKGAK